MTIVNVGPSILFDICNLFDTKHFTWNKKLNIHNIVYAKNNGVAF